MARIRTIKPSFWTDEKIGLLNRGARLTFLGLISAMADDEGRLKGNARIVRGAVYPFDDDISAAEVEEHLSQLAGASRIVRYRIAGDEFIQIANWRKHQKIDRPSASLFPAPEGMHSDGQTEDSPNARRTGVESSPSVLPLNPLESSCSVVVVERKKDAPAAPAPGVGVENSDDEAIRTLYPRVSESLPPAIGSDPLREFMARISQPRPYLAEMVGALDGMHGFTLTPQQLRVALVDWLANGETPNLRRFRGYLRGATPKEREAHNHNGAITKADRLRAQQIALRGAS